MNVEDLGSKITKYKLTNIKICPLTGEELSKETFNSTAALVSPQPKRASNQSQIPKKPQERSSNQNTSMFRKNAFMKVLSKRNEEKNKLAKKRLEDKQKEAFQNVISKRMQRRKVRKSDEATSPNIPHDKTRKKTFKFNEQENSTVKRMAQNDGEISPIDIALRSPRKRIRTMASIPGSSMTKIEPFRIARKEKTIIKEVIQENSIEVISQHEEA